MGISAHITDFGSKPCLNYIRITLKTKILLYFALFYDFLLCLSGLAEKIAQRRVWIQDTAIIQCETPTKHAE